MMHLNIWYLLGLSFQPDAGDIAGDDPFPRALLHKQVLTFVARCGSSHR